MALLMKLDAARTQHHAGDFSTAERAYREILAAEANNVPTLFLLGMLLIQTGRAAEATNCLRRTVLITPDHAKAHNALGVAYNAQGELSPAAAAFRAALQIEPDFTEAAHNLARILAPTQPAEAEALLNKVIERTPELAAAHSDLGSLLHGRNRSQEAEIAFRRALDLSPGLAEAARNIASIYKAEGRHDEARDIAPRLQDPLARFMADTTTPAILEDGASVPDIEAGYLAALDAAPAVTVSDPLAAFGALGHFYFAYYDRPLRTIHEATAATYRRLCPSLVYTAPHCRAPGRRRPRPRVAFVSSNYYSHTISRLFAGMVAGMANSFEVVAIAAGNRTDEATKRLSRAIPMVHLPADLGRARQVVADIEADAIVYLDIGMEPFTYFLAHARLAPLQLVTLGHPVTPGLDTIDGFISADYIDPPGAERDHTEQLHRLPAPAFYFDRPEVPERERTHFGLPERARLYVCPQTLFKMHPDFDALIAGTLRADPTGRLVLLAGSVPARRAALERRFAHTIPDVAERVVFLPSLPRTDFLALLRISDVMLDIPSFSGGNTTLEGLAAGVPIVTLPSTHLRGRMTAGLLHLAGLDHGIAETPADYCRRAVEAANDGAAYRAAIVEQAGALYRRQQAVTDFSTLVDRLIHG